MRCLTVDDWKTNGGRNIRIASAGHTAFAATMIALGILGLIRGNFAPLWQPVPKGVPARAVLIYLCALIPLATVAIFDHWRRSQFVFWKMMLLASALFAFFCYKRQLASVGDALLETQPGGCRKNNNRTARNRQTMKSCRPQL